MPQIGLAVAGAALSSVVAGSTFTLSTALFAIGKSLAISALQKALSPKAKGGGGVGNVDGGITKQVKNPLLPRRFIYGTQRVAGSLAYIGVSNGQKYLHQVWILCSHEIDGLQEIWFDDEPIYMDWLDANGNVTSGRFANKARIRFHAGTDNQTVDTALSAEIPEWTTNHRLRGCAYVYVRTEFDRDKYPSGDPNITYTVRGKKCYDPRTELTLFTENPAIISYDYLRDTRLGLGIADADIDEDEVIASANVCDEFVTTQGITMTVSSVDTTNNILSLGATDLLFQIGDRVTVASTGTIPAGLAAATDYYVIPYSGKGSAKIKLAESFSGAFSGAVIDITSAGTGTITVIKNAEPRYTASGTIEVSDEGDVQDALEKLSGAMAGQFVFNSGDPVRIFAGRYVAPNLSFDENDIIGSIKTKMQKSQREAFNRVIGVYSDPTNLWQPTNYKAISNSTYETQDGKSITLPYDLPFCTRSATAQRIAKIALEEMRQEIQFIARFKLTAMQVRAYDNVMLTNERYGWTDKVFTVMGWTLGWEEKDNVPTPYVEMTLKETASGVFDWAYGEETTKDLAPNTSLPDPFTVQAPSGLSFDSYPAVTRDGDVTYNILLNWDLHENSYVLQNGKFEVSYKEASAIDWRQAGMPDGSATSAFVAQASVGTEYDVRVRAINNLGVTSNYSYIYGVVAGSGGGIGTTNDWGSPWGSVVTSDDWGAFVSDPVGTTDDWGSFL